MPEIQRLEAAADHVNVDRPQKANDWLFGQVRRPYRIFINKSSALQP
jgi:hypothetical protein